MDLVTLLPSGIAAFLATNVDELLVITALYATPGVRGRDIVLGQVLGFAALIAASVVGALGLLFVPDAWVGALGLIPIAIGAYGLLGADRRVGMPDDTLLPAGGGATLAIAGITCANGADNIAIYIPLFATSGAGGMIVLSLLFGGLVAALCLAGRALGRQPAVLRSVAGSGHVVLSAVLIAIGVLILLQAGTIGALFY